MLDTPENLSKLANNLVFSLKNECGVKVKDVTDTLELIKSIFGPLVIFSSVAELSEKDSEAW
jgi:NAD-specific glutamate dehydrogenase